MCIQIRKMDDEVAVCTLGDDLHFLEVCNVAAHGLPGRTDDVRDVLLRQACGYPAVCLINHFTMVRQQAFEQQQASLRLGGQH